MSVDIFAFALMHMDLASLTTLPHYTCGDLRYYPGFVAQRDGEKLAAEVGPCTHGAVVL